MGNELVTFAQQALATRQKDALDQVSHMMMNLPLPRQYKSIGMYYHSFKLRREGGLDKARALLENLADEVPHWYRGRVIMSLAGLVFDSGDFQSALPLYLDANRAASTDGRLDLFTLAESQRQLAILKGLNGDHISAVAHLESLFPITRSAALACPSVWYDHLNSLAVELGELGRIEEASNVCKIVLASPMIGAYPEWRETGDEIEMKGYKSRSLVGFTRGSVRAENVLHLPVPEFMPRPASSYTGRAKILNYTDWKKKMVKEPNNNAKEGQAAGEVSDRQMLLKIVELASTDDLPDAALCEMVEALERIVKTHQQEYS
ncbi:MAG TPA: hypothetical protein VF747_02925 [Blastocatellia bacterium]